MITSQAARLLHTSIVRALSRKQMALALKELQVLASDIDEYSVYEQLHQVVDLYENMLRYQLQGVDDPQRKDLFRQLERKVLNLADTMKEHIFTASSAWFPYELKRSQGVNSQAISESLDVLKNFNRCLQIVVADNLEADENSLHLVEAEKSQVTLFNYVWLSGIYNVAQQEEVREWLDDEGLDANTRALIITALSLSVLRAFDRSKLMLLLGHCTSPHVEIRQRALVGVLLVMARHGMRIMCYKDVVERLTMLRDDERYCSEVEQAMLLLIRTCETSVVSQAITEKLIPGILKVKTRLNSKLDQLLNGDNAAKRANLEELLADSGAEDALRQFNDLQLSGADVYANTFAAMKRFPFFNTVSNWVLPFSKYHSLVLPLFNQSDISAKMFTLLLNGQMLCSSDRYAFCHSIAYLPIDQRSKAIEALNLDPEQMTDISQSEELHRLAQVTVKGTVDNYIKDLYRLFTQHPRKTDLESPLPELLSMYKMSVFNLLFSAAGALRIADYLFAMKQYANAKELYHRLLDEKSVTASDTLYRQLAYCHQQLGDYDVAIELYLLALDLNDNDRWVRERLAYCYRKTEQYAKALSVYELLQSVEPENIKIVRQQAVCLMELEQYEESLKLCFKMDYLDPDKLSTWRLLAWNAILVNKYDTARKYYDKLLLHKEANSNDWMNGAHLSLIEGDVKIAVGYYKKALAMSVDQKSFISTFEDDTRLILLPQGVDEELINAVLNAVLLNLDI